MNKTNVCHLSRRGLKAAYTEKPGVIVSHVGLSSITAGSDLLSHTVSHAVPSAVASLTSVFGMGTGVTLLL
jgi:hypothetical protein